MKYDVVIDKDGFLYKKSFGDDLKKATEYYVETLKTLHRYLQGNSGGHFEDENGAALVMFDDNGGHDYMQLNGFVSEVYWNRILENKAGYENLPEPKEVASKPSL